MDQELIFYTMLGMAAVTYIPRMLPIMFLASRSMPGFLIRWLSYVPISVLSAMLLPELLVKNNNIDFSLDNIFLLTAIPTMLVGWLTKSLYLTVFTGMGIIAVYRYFI
jgi:branched-subunit amino acid transport protein